MIHTGVPNLDRILGGGIPKGDVVLVNGPAGSGKTTLCFQVCFTFAASGGAALYVSTLSEPPPRLVRHLRSFSFYDEERIGETLHIRNVYPIVREGLERTIEALIDEVKKCAATLLVIDGLDTIRDLHSQKEQMRTFVYELAGALGSLECTTLLTSTVRAGGVGAFPELTMSDSVVLLEQSTSIDVTRTIQLQKVRGQAPLLGHHSLRIDSSGIRIYPRVESITAPSTSGLGTKRPLGLPVLDQMSGGGLLPGSTTLVAGAPGTGKTLLGLRFLVSGAERGEKGLYVGFREPPQLLVDKTQALDLDVKARMDEGSLKVVRLLPIDVSVDEMFGRIFQDVESFQPQRLVIDSSAEIENVVSDERRRRAVLTCLVELIRSSGITAIVTREISQMIGPELDFSDSPLAALGENLLLLRWVEFRAELYRVLSLLKMRDTAHDRTIREYEIGKGGLSVHPASDRPEVLSGISRLPSEMRVKRNVGIDAKR